MVNPNWYLTNTCIGIYWLIIGLYSLIISNYWLRLSKSCHMSYLLNIGQTSVKHWFKVSVKHQLVLVCFYMRVLTTFPCCHNRTDGQISKQCSFTIPGNVQFNLLCILLRLEWVYEIGRALLKSFKGVAAFFPNRLNCWYNTGCVFGCTNTVFRSTQNS